MGAAVIDHAPGWFVRFGIDRFGTDDKPALVTGIVVLSLLIGTGLGLLARRRLLYAGIGFGAFGVLGTAAAARQPLTSVPWSVVTAVLGVAAGIGTLAFLLRWAATVPDAKPEVVAFERRRFLLTAGGFAVFAATTALIGRRLLETAASAAQRLGVALPLPATPAAP